MLPQRNRHDVQQTLFERSAAEVPEELGCQASAIVKAITDRAPLLGG